ncbi:MAG: iron ABC transporter permease [Treponema sp.]|nr:iron ABC transporter permease [Treponema sp.]
MMKQAEEKKTVILLSLLPLGLVVLCFLLPYGAALSSSFSKGFNYIREVIFDKSDLAKTVTFTFTQAFLSTLLALALGLPGAWFLGKTESREKKVLRALTGIPFALPSILVVLGFVLFFGNAGWLNKFIMLITGKDEGPIRILYRPAAIILAHAFYNFPLVIRLVGDTISRIKQSYIPAAENLGASPFKSSITIILPLLLPAIISAALLIFLYCFTSFAIVQVLGGGPPATTLGVEIYRYANIAFDYAQAGIFAAIETCIALAVFLLYLYFDRKSRTLTGAAEDTRGNGGTINQSSKKYNWIFLLYAIVICIFIAGPILSILLESFLFQRSRAAPVFSLQNWINTGTLFSSLFNSLSLAVLAASTSVFIGFLAASSYRMLNPSSRWRPVLHTGFSMLLLSSGVVLGFGWLMLYRNIGIPVFVSLILMHALSAFPFSFFSILEGLNGISNNTLNAASLAGANPLRKISSVILPSIFPRLSSAWAFAFAVSMGELNTVLMLGSSDWITLPLYIYRAAGSYRFGTACVGGTVLILFTLITFYFSDLSIRKTRNQ